MKFIIVFAALFAVAFARPGDVETLRYTSENAEGSYKYDFATSDGTSQTVSGAVKNAGTDAEALVIRGSFSFVGTDGTTYTVNYVADENGFQPEGKHLPVA